MIDSATRMGFLTFLPFILTAKGASLPTIGLALTLVFAGGAVGKLVCAYIGARIGVIGTVFLTEIMTLVLIFAILPLPLEAAMVMLPLLGIALNGTSSVLYGSVPDLVPAERRTRAFGIFYTGTIGAGAIAPILYGLVSDAHRPDRRRDPGGEPRGADLAARLGCCGRADRSAPIAEHGLNERQRRDRGGVGAQDARTERQPHDIRLCAAAARAPPRQSRLPDRPEPRAACRARSPTAPPTGSRVCASSSQKISTRPGDNASSAFASGSASAISAIVRMPHCSAASIAFARMRSRLTRAAWVWRVVTGCRREHAEFDRLLHHVIEPRMLERREQVMQIGRRDPAAGSAPRSTAIPISCRRAAGPRAIRRRGR